MNETMQSLVAWKRYATIPFCNILSHVFTRILNEGYVSANSGNVNISSTRTIECILRVFAAEYVRTILHSHSNYSSTSNVKQYPTVLIVPSSADRSFSYTVHSDFRDGLNGFDDLTLNSYAQQLLEDFNSDHPDITKIIGSQLSSKVRVLWIDERRSHIMKLLHTHILPEEMVVHLPPGKFIVDRVDYEIIENSAEHTRIKALKPTSVVCRALESKVY